MDVSEKLAQGFYTAATWPELNLTLELIMLSPIFTTMFMVLTS